MDQGGNELALNEPSTLKKSTMVKYGIQHRCVLIIRTRRLTAKSRSKIERCSSLLPFLPRLCRLSISVYPAKCASNAARAATDSGESSSRGGGGGAEERGAGGRDEEGVGEGSRSMLTRRSEEQQRDVCRSRSSAKHQGERFNRDFRKQPSHKHQAREVETRTSIHTNTTTKHTNRRGRRRTQWK